MKGWWYHVIMAWLAANLALVAWLLRPANWRRKDDDETED